MYPSNYTRTATADKVTLPVHEIALIHIKFCFKNYGVVAFFYMAKHHQRDMFLSSSFTINILKNLITFIYSCQNPKKSILPFLSSMTLGKLLDILNSLFPS